MEDKEEHLKLSLEHISKRQRRQLVIFLDNVDQRKPAFQEQVFMMANAFAANWPVTAFVALRPETFSLSRTRGTLAAYQPRVFTIEPPRIDLVLQKRLAFALDQLKKASTLPGMGDGFSIHSESLEQYLKMLISAFYNRDDIIGLIDNMCSGNVRRALEYVSYFVGSGHVDSVKILDIIDQQGNYYLPLHEFLRGVIYRDSEHYDPSQSPFPNIFDISTNDPREHFASLLTLAYTEQAGQVGGASGFVQRDRANTFLKGFGFHEEQISDTVRRLIEKELIVTPVGLKDDVQDRLRITTAGAYTLKKMCAFFAYLDAVVVDTPITDSSVRGIIKDERAIADRLRRGEAFLSYLDECWTKLADIAVKTLDWPALSATARTNIQEIKRKVGAS